MQDSNPSQPSRSAPPSAHDPGRKDPEGRPPLTSSGETGEYIPEPPPPGPTTFPSDTRDASLATLDPMRGVEETGNSFVDGGALTPTVDPEHGIVIGVTPPPAFVATVPPEQGVDYGDPSSPRSAPKARKLPPLPEVPGYEILGELGRGGMGVVYKARHLVLDRTVALKMVLAGASATPDQLERFISEARSVARLQHPNIVQIFEIGEYAGLPFFSLEFCDGGSLHQKAGRKPQPPCEAAATVEVLARAMGYAHERGVIHRDLKPANILLSSSTTEQTAPQETSRGSKTERDPRIAQSSASVTNTFPKITDFGLARRLEGDAGRTREGTVMGSPSYMAPEQAAGKIHEVGPLADVYSLGAILYELLTGRAPFVGTELLDTLEQVRTREPVPPTQLATKVPADIETICLKCLQKEPSRRYASALALAEDLQRFLEGRPILARPVSSLERLTRWARRNPKVALLSGAAAFGLTAAVVLTSAIAIREADRRRFAEDAAQRERDLGIQKDEERKRADLNAEAAGRRQDLALDALRTFSQILDNRLREDPRLGNLRQQILNLVSKELIKLGEEADKMTTLSRDTARTQQRLGDIHYNSGEMKQAFERYSRVHDVVLSLEKSATEEERAIAVRNVGASFNKLGDVLHRLGETVKARDSYRESLKRRELWLQLAPTNPGARQAIAESHLLIGRSCMALGRPHEAVRHLTEARQRFADLPEPEHPRDRLTLLHQKAETATVFGDAAMRTGDGASARTAFLEALTIGQNLPRAGFPAAPRLIARALLDLGDFVLLAENNPALARETYQNTLRLFEAAWKADSEYPLGVRDRALTHYRLGVASQERSREPITGSGLWNAIADAHFEQSRALQAPLAAIDRSNTQAQIDFLLVQARCGQVKPAADLAAALRKSSPRDPRVLFFVACGYSLAGLPGEAIAAIREAVNLGYADLFALEHDPDLDRVRSDPAYRAIVEEVRAGR